MNVFFSFTRAIVYILYSLINIVEGINVYHSHAVITHVVKLKIDTLWCVMRVLVCVTGEVNMNMPWPTKHSTTHATYTLHLFFNHLYHGHILQGPATLLLHAACVNYTHLLSIICVAECTVLLYEWSHIK
jgi:hypothetical protein